MKVIIPPEYRPYHWLGGTINQYDVIEEITAMTGPHLAPGGDSV